jgi:predicted RNase H-like HicB family nuclease
MVRGANVQLRVIPPSAAKGKTDMSTTMNMVYWKGEKFWVGKLLDHPEIMTQGETIEELEANLREAYLLMAMDDVPEEHSIKPIAI